MNAGSGGKSLRKAVEKVAGIQKEDAIDKKADVRLADEKVEDSKSTRTMREIYAKKVYGYLIGYSLAAYSLILAHGFRLWDFSLESPTLSIIVGSTAVSAIGLVGLVVKGLFK